VLVSILIADELIGVMMHIGIIEYFTCQMICYISTKRGQCRSAKAGFYLGVAPGAVFAMRFIVDSDT
jgi:hypothetical protein